MDFKKKKKKLESSNYNFTTQSLKTAHNLLLRLVKFVYELY